MCPLFRAAGHTGGARAVFFRQYVCFNPKPQVGFRAVFSVSHTPWLTVLWPCLTHDPSSALLNTIGQLHENTCMALPKCASISLSPLLTQQMFVELFLLTGTTLGIEDNRVQESRNACPRGTHSQAKGGRQTDK